MRRIPDGGGGVGRSARSLRYWQSGHHERTTQRLSVHRARIRDRPVPRRLRFVAAGIGITPILPMVRHVERLGVEWSMVTYAGRSRDSLPFLDEVAGVRRAHRTSGPTICTAIPTAAQLLGDCADGTAVYACGPAPMLTAIRAQLAGRDGVELHFERFAAPPVIDGEAFSVCVASTGATVQVGAE